MRKIFCIFALGLAIFCSGSLLYANENIRVFVDEEEVVFDQASVIYEGHTLIPVRAVSEALGGVVDYVFDMEESIVTVEKDGVFIKFFLEKNIALLNSEEVTLDAAPRIFGDRAMVPLRFISESFGLTVIWDEVSGDIHIYSDGEYALTEKTEKTDKIGGEIPEQLPIPSRFITYPWEGNYVTDTFYTHSGMGFATTEYAKNIPVDSLVRIAGYIENVVVSFDENEPSYVILESGGIVWTARFMGNLFTEESIGKGYYFFGVFEGVDNRFGFETPMLYILRDIDMNNKVRIHRLAGFELAYIFEGQPLSTPGEIENFLNTNYAGDSTKDFYFVFQIVENAEFDYTLIVKFNENHEMGNVLRFANISEEQREKVKEALKSYMLMLANGLTQKCPDIKFNGYYYDSYSVDVQKTLKTYEMRFASWSNNVNGIYKTEQGSGLINWLPSLDYDWISKAD